MNRYKIHLGNTKTRASALKANKKADAIALLTIIEKEIDGGKIVKACLAYNLKYGTSFASPDEQKSMLQRAVTSTQGRKNLLAAFKTHMAKL